AARDDDRVEVPAEERRVRLAAAALVDVVVQEVAEVVQRHAAWNQGRAGQRLVGVERRRDDEGNREEGDHDGGDPDEVTPPRVLEPDLRLGPFRLDGRGERRRAGDGRSRVGRAHASVSSDFVRQNANAEMAATMKKMMIATVLARA